MPVVEAGGGGSGGGKAVEDEKKEGLIFGSGTKQYTVTVLPDEVVKVVVKE